MTLEAFLIRRQVEAHHDVSRVKDFTQ